MSAVIEDINPLCDLIATKIKQNNHALSFAEFMQLALYAPGLGYYSTIKPKFGTQGDFITAPELGSLFAKCLAAQCQQIFNALDAANILEIGAGSGQLAFDLLQNLKIDKYQILELSAGLRQQQQHKLKTLPEDLFNKIEWLDQLPTTAQNTVIIANEVLDAMPIHRFRWHHSELQEYYVTINDCGFEFMLRPASIELRTAFDNAGIANYIGSKNTAYDSEMNLWITPWLRSLQHSLRSGAILIFDYGFTRREFYHPERNTGTLICHYQHHCHPDPLHNIGLQDITAHVDFTAVAEAADSNNLHVAGFSSFASFLLNCGITRYLDQSIKQNQELQILTSPAEMGELFKAMVLCKNVDLDLLGFQQFDIRYKL